MEQLKRLRREDAKKRATLGWGGRAVQLPCTACGAMPPCRHTRSDGPDQLRVPS